MVGALSRLDCLLAGIHLFATALSNQDQRLVPRTLGIILHRSLNCGRLDDPGFLRHFQSGHELSLRIV